jgi:hypothetical protein
MAGLIQIKAVTLVAPANAAGTAPPAEASAGGISPGTGVAIPPPTLTYQPIAPGMIICQVQTLAQVSGKRPDKT